jgi:hypothetical protein
MTMASTVAMIFFMFVSSIKICLCRGRLCFPDSGLQRKHHYVVKIFTDFSSRIFQFSGQEQNALKIGLKWK